MRSSGSEPGRPSLAIDPRLFYSKWRLFVNGRNSGKYVEDTAWIIIKLGHITAFGALYEIDKVFEAIVALKEISRLVSAEKRMRSQKKSQKFALR